VPSLAKVQADTTLPELARELFADMADELASKGPSTHGPPRRKRFSR
jgi:hypothetical protein